MIRIAVVDKTSAAQSGNHEVLRDDVCRTIRDFSVVVEISLRADDVIRC